MNKLRSAISIILILMIVVSLAACEKKNEAQTEEQVVGGWSEDVEMSQEELDVFDKAVAGTDYADYTAVSLLGVQVVAGRNYKFLCQDAAGAEYVMVVYRDLSDNCSVTSVEAR